MGSVGSASKLPKYSNEKGVILESTVVSDPRYEVIRNNLTPKYQASDLLRAVMRVEERGDTEGQINVHDFQVAEGQKYGQLLNEYIRALKAVGYKVYERENLDTHSRGYATPRGGRVYASTSRQRLLKFRKI